MADPTFEKSNVMWQIGLWRQQFNEWVEVQLKNLHLPHLPNLPFPADFLEILFWLILVALCLWIIWQLIPILRPLWFQSQPSSQPSQTPQLPYLLPDQTVAQWLRQAQQFQQQGNYGQACRALYLAMLQRLHDQQLALHDPSRSDGEYLHLTQTFSPPKSYQTLIQTHERVCFGADQPSEDMFRQCQQAYQEIDPQ